MMGGDLDCLLSPSKKRKKTAGSSNVNSTYPEPHDNQALVYDRKENLDLSLQNQFDYAGLSGNSLIHYMNNNGSSMYGPVPPDMHMNSIVSSNGSVGAQFVITKPRAPRRNSLAGKWNKEEDEQLKIIVQEHGAKNWKKIAALLGETRTDVQCLHRWNKVLKPGLSKGNWTLEEDQIVKSMVLTYGVGNIKWSAISQRLPGRIGKQCRERWFNHLDPVIKRTEWTPAEEMILYQSQRHFGNRWKEMAKMLPGRTENAVKNRWNSMSMRKWMEERNLQPGDGSSSHVSTKDGMLAALEAFKRSLIEAEIELEVDISSAAVIDRLFDDMGRGSGVAGSSGKKKLGRQAGAPTLQFGVASNLLNGKGMQQPRYDDDYDEEDSEGEHDSDCDNEDYPDDGTVASSSVTGGKGRMNALHHTQHRVLQYQPPMQKESDDTAELVEILNQLRRTSSASPVGHPVKEKSITLGLMDNNNCSSNNADNLVQYDSAMNDGSLDLLSPMDSYRYSNGDTINEPNRLIEMGLINANAASGTPSGFAEASSPSLSNVFESAPKTKSKTRPQNGRSISFAEDFIYDSDRLAQNNGRAQNNDSVGIGFSKIAAIRRKKQANQLSDSDYLNFEGNPISREGNAPPLAPSAPQPTLKSKANRKMTATHGQSSTTNAQTSEPQGETSSSNFSYTMPKSPASIAMQKLDSKLSAAALLGKSGRAKEEEDEDEDEEIPLESLCFFKHLSESAKRNLIKQLISRFQRTSFTPRHHAVLNTPGNSSSKPAAHVGPSPSQNGNHGHGMMNDCMMHLQSASIASIGGVGAFSEDPCLFNQQFSSMDSLDSNIFEMSDLDYFVEHNQIYCPSVDNAEMKGYALDNLLNNSLDGDFGLCISATKRSKTDASADAHLGNMPGSMSAPHGMMLMSSTVTPSMNILKSEGAGTLYDEAAIEAAAEIAMLATINTEKKYADQLVKAILTDNLPLLNAAAISIISSSNQQVIGAGVRLSLPPTRMLQNRL